MTRLRRSAADVTYNGANVSGDVTLVEAAANYQYERATLRIDAAAGVAAPFGVGADS